MEPTTKKCSKCGEEKERSAFSPTKQQKSRLTNSCKACRRAKYHTNPEPAKARARAYNKENKEKLSAYVRSRREADPSLAILKSEYDKNYRAENTERKRENDKRYRLENIEAITLKKKLWYWSAHETNRTAINEKAQKHRTELSSVYISHFLCSYVGLSRGTIKANPDLIPVYTEQIRTRRLIKTFKQQAKPL